ncbi:GTP-binding protein YqeH [Williamsoniiplasma somnilux]|uniref:GTP-binding protein YqeH n=1 Tax=Williamsoniiplasma somnilux TaxID=215578 RepID=A0A2K8NY37_9MOLU|nr:ribosome biogenesis GTPase YqeH [Williamsoniiplasma somnilux]ATZ18745.1 GTP-binding protein YqeH [Williamsoniiplasma somnilux]
MKKCSGCGSVLQSTNEKTIGYVKNIDANYCLRCFRIKHYNDLINQDLDPKLFLQSIINICNINKKNKFYYVLDIFDLENSRIFDLEKIIAKHEVVILINKIDLLPRSVKKTKIKKYIEDYFKETPLNNAKVMLTTKRNGKYIEILEKEILKFDGDQYFIGSSNVGKTSLINAILKYSNKPAVGVESKFFNTTLDLIEIIIAKNKKIFDTPGVSRTNSLALATDPKQWKYFYFKKEVKQYSYQLEQKQAIIFGSVVWIEFVFATNVKNSIHVYANPEINLHRTKISNAFDYIDRNYNIIFPQSSNSKLLNVFKEEILIQSKYKSSEKLDILLPGLGWINFNAKEVKQVNIFVNSNTDNKNNYYNFQVRKALI